MSRKKSKEAAPRVLTPADETAAAVYFLLAKGGARRPHATPVCYSHLAHTVGGLWELFAGHFPEMMASLKSKRGKKGGQP